MFDGVPEFYARRRRDRRLRVGAGVVLFLTAAALVSFGRVAPIAAETVISSPSHLRQVEVFAAPGGEKIFYLHNAGYRMPHKLQLIGIVYGADGCSVQWQGPDRIRILLHPGWSRLVAGHPKGVAVAFAKAP